MDRKENSSILELRELLDSHWFFTGLENKQKVAKVDKELILDKDFDFINIITDFYKVEVLNNYIDKHSREKSNHNIIREVSDCYGNLLRLKLFYHNELSNILENIENLDGELRYCGSAFLELLRLIDTWEDFFELYKQTKLEDIIFGKKLTQKQKKIFQLSLLNNIFLIFLNQGSGKNYVERILSKDDHWQSLINISKGILIEIDKNKKQIEPTVFALEEIDLKRIERVLNINDLASKYLDKIRELELKTFDKREVKCYGSVRKNNIIYMTLNGVKDTDIEVNKENGNNLQKVVNILAELLGGDVEYVSITPDTRYYVNPDLYINYSQYEASKGNLKDLNRMFTCCERKLIAKMFSPECIDEGKIKLLISKYPCVICSRTIEIVNKVKKRIEIIDPLEEDENLKPCLIARMDECARIIDVQHPREQKYLN